MAFHQIVKTLGERDVIADDPTDLTDEPEVSFPILAEHRGRCHPPSRLYDAVSSVFEGLEFRERPVEIVHVEDDGRHRGKRLLHAAAEQPSYRLAEHLALRVPKRHVDRADREGGNTLDAVPEGMAAHLLPQHLDVKRVSPEDEPGKSLVDEHLRREGSLGELRDRLAPAHDAVVGLDPDQCHAPLRTAVMRLLVLQRNCLNPTYHERSASVP